jgi:hypothetical protein
MRVDSLPSPGDLSNSILLRREAAKAISSVEITSVNYPGGLSGQATKLHGFFTGCAATLAALRDVTAPTIVAVNRPASEPGVLRVRFSEAMDESVLCAASAFVCIPADTLLDIAWTVGRDDELVVRALDGSFAGVTNLAYTQPGVNQLRDRGGNLVATDATTPITDIA